MTLTIELSPETEDRLKQEAAQRGQRLPDYVRELLECLPAAAETEAEKDARYRAGYQRLPETQEELAAIDAVGAAGLAWDPWE